MTPNSTEGYIDNYEPPSTEDYADDYEPPVLPDVVIPPEPNNILSDEWTQWCRQCLKIYSDRWDAHCDEYARLQGNAVQAPLHAAQGNAVQAPTRTDRSWSLSRFLNMIGRFFRGQW